MSRPVPASPGGRQLLRLPAHVVVAGCVVLAVTIVLVRGLYHPVSTHDTISIACGLATMALLAYARYSLQFPWLSASLVYLMLFWMFHYGLTFTAVLVPDVLAGAQDWENAWMYWPNVRLAMLLGVLGTAGFVFGAGLMGRPAQPALEPDRSHNSVLYGVGWVVMCVGAALTIRSLVAAGGFGVLAMSYGQMRSNALGNLQIYADLCQLGCLLALCGAGGRRWIYPLPVFAATAAMMLLVGLRAEALVPAVAFTIVLAYRGVRIRSSVVAAAVLVAVVVIPAVRVIRTVGFSNRSLVNWTEVSPLETLTELGGTLRAAKAYVDFIEQGEEYLLGASYWAPFDRQVLVRLVPGREPIPYEQDERVPERFIPLLEGAVGSSATGEAYYNFGAAGPFIYFGVLGMLFGWLERRASASRYHCALLGVAMLVFYFNIRSSWLAVPAHVGAALVIIGSCYVLSDWRPTRRRVRRPLHARTVTPYRT